MANDENKFLPIFQILDVKNVSFLLKLEMALATTITMKFEPVCDSSKKQMEHTQNGILSGFHLFLEESGTSYFAFEIYRHLEKKSQKPEIIIFHDFFISKWGNGGEFMKLLLWKIT